MAKKSVNTESQAPELAIIDEPPAKTAKEEQSLGEMLRQFITHDDGEITVDEDWYFAGLKSSQATELRTAVDLVNAHNDRHLPAMAVEVSRCMLNAIHADLDDGATGSEEMSLAFYGGQMLNVAVTAESGTADDKGSVTTLFGHGRKTGKDVWKNAEDQVTSYWDKLLADKS